MKNSFISKICSLFIVFVLTIGVIFSNGGNVYAQEEVDFAILRNGEAAPSKGKVDLKSENITKYPATEDKFKELAKLSMDFYNLYEKDNSTLSAYSGALKAITYILEGDIGNPETITDSYIDRILERYKTFFSKQFKEKLKTMAAELEAKKDSAPDNADRIQATIDKLNEYANSVGELTPGDPDLVATLNAAKSLLDDPNAKPDVPGFAAQPTADELADKFRQDNNDILSKTEDNVVVADREKLDNALTEYGKLDSEVKDKLTTEKQKLDVLDALLDKVEEFKSQNSELLNRNESTVSVADKDAVKALLDKLNGSDLDDNAKRLLEDEKNKLETLLTTIESKEVDSEVKKYKEANSEILAKTVDDVTVNDRDILNKAINDYNSLSEGAKKALSEEKKNLDALNKELENLTAADNFINNNPILNKNIDELKIADKDAVLKAIDDYNKLPDDVKNILTTENEKLSDMKKILDSLDKFITENSDILSKTEETVLSNDRQALDKALTDYAALDKNIADKLLTEKENLDKLKSLLDKVEEFKLENADLLGKDINTVSVEDKNALVQLLDKIDAPEFDSNVKRLLENEIAKLKELLVAIEDKETASEISKYKNDNADILAKTKETVTIDDLTILSKAIDEYNSLSDKAKAALSKEYENLLEMKEILYKADKFILDNSDILSKTQDNITLDDKVAVDKALSDYAALDKDVADKLLKEKEELTKLSLLLGQVITIKSEYADIFNKSVSDVTLNDRDIIKQLLDKFTADDVNNNLKRLLSNEINNLKELLSAIDNMKTMGGSSSNNGTNNNSLILAKTGISYQFTYLFILIIAVSALVIFMRKKSS